MFLMFLLGDHENGKTWKNGLTAWVCFGLLDGFFKKIIVGSDQSSLAHLGFPIMNTINTLIDRDRVETC